MLVTDARFSLNTEITNLTGLGRSRGRVWCAIREALTSLERERERGWCIEARKEFDQFGVCGLDG